MTKKKAKSTWTPERTEKFRATMARKQAEKLATGAAAEKAAFDSGQPLPRKNGAGNRLIPRGESLGMQNVDELASRSRIPLSSIPPPQKSAKRPYVASAKTSAKHVEYELAMELIRLARDLIAR